MRARAKGHIKAVFPNAKLYQREGSDYLYRADLLRTEVAAAMSALVLKVDYTNFKKSVKNDALHDRYLDVWHTMGKLQPGGPYGRSKALKRT